MPFKSSYFGSQKPESGVKPIETSYVPKTPFGVKKWPINQWNGKHMPLHKEPQSTVSETTPSTVRMFWTMSTGGDPIEQNTAPANTAGYFWTISKETDRYNVHSFYMVEKALTSVASLALYWDGVLATCRPPTPAGKVWEVVSVNGLAIYMESRCVSLYDTPGYCPVTGTLAFVDENGDPVNGDVADGSIDLPNGTVINGISTATGEPVTLTVDASGYLQGFVGSVSIMDPTTGDASIYRIGSTGRIEE